MWNPKTELAKKAVEIAKEKHPDGFNKGQLIDASKDVYGGFGITQVPTYLGEKKIVTMEDVNNMGNAMANIDGHYPVGMSTCYIVGINGGCGLDCPAYLSGDCENEGEMWDDDMDEEQKTLHIDIYDF